MKLGTARAGGGGGGGGGGRGGGHGNALGVVLIVLQIAGRGARGEAQATLAARYMIQAGRLAQRQLLAKHMPLALGASIVLFGACAGRIGRGCGSVLILAPHHALSLEVGGSAHLHLMDAALAPLAVAQRQIGRGSRRCRCRLMLAAHLLARRLDDGIQHAVQRRVAHAR